MPTPRAIATVLVLLLLSAPGLANAGWAQFRHDSSHSGVADVSGAIVAPRTRWTFAPDGSILGAPATAVVNGEQLLFFATYRNVGVPGTVYAMTSTGQQKWATLPVGSAGGYISSPTVADLDGDGWLEVVIANLEDSNVRALNASTGAVKWTANIGSAGTDLLASSPVVAELVSTSAGREIVLGGSRSNSPGDLLILSSTGRLLQALPLDGPSWSTPVVADLTGDGVPEIALATGIPPEIELLFPNGKSGGHGVFVFERSGNAWQQRWTYNLPGASLSSPVAADFDNDGQVELVVGAFGDKMYVLNGATGIVEASSRDFNMLMPSIGSPAFADVDADGKLEIVQGLDDGFAVLEMVGTKLVEQHRVVLPTVPHASGNVSQPGTSVALADIDGDARLDILIATIPLYINVEDILRSDALPGHLYAYRGATPDAPNGMLWSRPFARDGSLGGPIVADIDGDGLAEVIVGEGVPLIGDGKLLHVFGAANPVIRSIGATPAEPTDLEDVAFSAVVRDEDTPAAAITYAWSFGDGRTSAQAAPRHRYADDGVYVVKLTVRDATGHTWNATREITVRNVAPQVAPAASGTPGELTVTLDANALDLDGSVTRVTWTLGDGATAEGTRVTHAYAAAGTYDVTATATDDDGAQSVAVIRVGVNRAPTLSAPAAGAVAEDAAIEIAFEGTDPDGHALRIVAATGIRNVSWTDAPGGFLVRATPGFDEAGERELAITVEDAGNPPLRATHVVALDVADTDRAPSIAPMPPVSTTRGRLVSIDVRATDLDGDAVTLALVDAPEGAAVDPETHRFTWRPSEVGTFALRFLAESRGLTAEQVLTVRVAENAPPTARIDAPAAADAGEAIRFAAVDAEDPEEAGPLAFAWDFDAADGFSPDAHGANVTFVPREMGPRTVTLRVTDADGYATFLTHDIVVDDALVLRTQLLQAGAARRAVFAIDVADERGVPVADALVTLTVVLDAGEGRVLHALEGRTASDGSLVVFVPYDVTLGRNLGANLPGRHLVDIVASAPSRSGAPVDDIEKAVVGTSYFIAG